LGEPAARAAALTIMVAGEEAVFRDHAPALRSMGRKVAYLGPHGRAQLAKLVSNGVALSTLAAFSEGLVLAAKNGIAPETMYDILTHSIGDSRELRHAGPGILKGEFEPGFALDLALKDLDLTLEAADESGVPVGVAAAVRKLFAEARAAGLGGQDCRSVVKILEAACDAPVRAAAGWTEEREPSP
jgi:3-hydroxyisobutyrate dehydrogenase-like beta-hydroxyacid dehydrogenase